MTTDKTSRLAALFQGFADAYGTYDGTQANAAKGGKLEIKASAKTKREPVTLDIWRAHVEGRTPVGIIPIREDDSCYWGAIDIDDYEVDVSVLLSDVTRLGFPLVACRTKSGGVHLYLFVTSPVTAEVMAARLKEMAAALGRGSAEIFPKQRHVELSRGDLGSWLNMPYFGGDETDRYGYKAGALGMTLGEFLSAAETARCPPESMQKSLQKKVQSKGASSSATEKNGEVKDVEFGDGPPCMQYMAATGVPEGGRNKALLNFAIFAKKKYPQKWQEVVEDWNRRFFDPPLPSTEVVGVMRGLEKKDYFYTCKDHPLCNHCNSTLCRTRRHGVGNDEDVPKIGSLTILQSDPPVWFLDVNDERLELNTDQLRDFHQFHRTCMERLHVCFKMMKQENWLTVVALAMREATLVDSSPEVSREGQFAEYMEEFVTNRHRGEALDDILVGRPYHDVDTGRHYFRLRDLDKYIQNAGMKNMTRGQMTARIRDMGGGKHFFNIKGKGCNVWWVPEDKFEVMPQLGLPKVRGEPI